MRRRCRHFHELERLERGGTADCGWQLLDASVEGQGDALRRRARERPIVLEVELQFRLGVGVPNERSDRRHRAARGGDLGCEAQLALLGARLGDRTF